MLLHQPGKEINNLTRHTHDMALLSQDLVHEK